MLEVSKNQLLHQMLHSEPIANRPNSSNNKRLTLTPKNSVRVWQTYFVTIWLILPHKSAQGIIIILIHSCFITPNKKKTFCYSYIVFFK